MADSFTGNLNLRKPEVGHADDTWGGTAGLNSDLDMIDAIFLATGLGTAVGLHVGPAQVLNVEGGITFKDPTDTTKVVALDRSLLTTATTRTLSFPDEDGILATQGYLHRTVPTGTVLSGYYGSTPPVGTIFLDGRTIGDATSGATNRANADTVNLYTLFWTMGIAPTGGRGASAAADFAAHKPLAVPNHSGRTMAGRDNLSGTAAGVMAGWNTAGFVGGATTSATGSFSMSALNNINFGNVGFVFQSGSGSVVDVGATFGNGTGGTVNYTPPNAPVTITSVGGYVPINANFNIGVSGASNAFNIVQPTIAVDVVIAL